MLLISVPEETFCLKTHIHSPVKVGSNLVCYRCGFLVGAADDSKMGSLLDY